MAFLPSRLRPVLSGGRAARLWRDGTAVLVLLVVPVLRYAWPAFTGGALVMPGDDYDQNFPLRVLVGHQIRDGIIPLLDPFNWSGSPLLGGWNSGAAYPATWLFAIMPANAAWVLGELLTYWVGGIGLYAFLRAQTVDGRALRPLPALLGAASFSVGGAFAIQVEHFGLAAGVSWIPLALLAIWKLSTSDRPLRWVLMLGASGGMCVLAGEPRAVAIAAVVLAVYVGWRVVRQPAGRWRLVVLLAAGGFLALLLSAVQWAPGMEVVADSQRDGGGYRLFGAGSMAFGQLPLILQPMLLGGSGNGGYPAFLGGYSLTEIASYVGLLPLVAAGAFVRRWRRPLPEWVCWLGLAVLGVLLALGSSTPLGHVWHLIPFYGGQRLQSRNILITGLALSVLLAYWAQEWIDRPQLRRRLGMLVPLGGAVGLCIAGIVAGPRLVRGLGVPAESAAAAGDLRPVLIVFLVFAVACGALLVLASRLPRPVRAGAVAVLVTFDLTAFTLTVIQEGSGGDSGGSSE
ncbi:MAG TPA: hypothetical protein VHC49_27480, partial [Mycobacteriales bacterium]|nr:hypothetical protein [Mycobacteriales bacterium]